MTQQEYFNEGIEAEARRLGVNVYQRAELIKAQENHLARYTPPSKSEVEPYTSPAQAATDLVLAVGKPLVMLTAVGGVVVVIVASAAAAVGAVFAFVAENVVYIGGGLFAVVAVVLGVGGLRFGGSKQSPPKEEPKRRFYQRQEQGWEEM